MANSNLPKWYNMFPHTCFSFQNLDWLISKYGEQDDAIKRIEESDAAQTERLDGIDETIEGLDGRLTTAEGNISVLQDDTSGLGTRLTAAEDDISALDGRLASAEGDITALDGRVDGLDNSVSGLDTRLTTAEGAISDLQSDVSDLSGLATQVQRNTNDISGLDSRVITLEGAKVTANPGGSPSVNLNTIRIGSTDYAVPSGGGGGGSSVTPNPAGTPTATLDSVDIDGTIYDIPSGVDTSDMIAEEYDPTQNYVPGDIRIHNNVLYECNDNTTGAWDSSKWTATTCAEIAQSAVSTAENIEALYAALGTFYEDTASAELTTSSTTKDYLPGTRRTLTPGSWLITFNATFDTHELGSKQRGLYTYIDKDGAVIAQGGKYMWGSEAITDINYANSVSISAVINVPTGTTSVITPQVRVPVNTGSGDYTVDIRVGYVCIKPIN